MAGDLTSSLLGGSTAMLLLHNNQVPSFVACTSKMDSKVASGCLAIAAVWTSPHTRSNPQFSIVLWPVAVERSVTLTFTSQKYGGIAVSTHFDWRGFGLTKLLRSLASRLWINKLYLCWSLRHNFMRDLLTGLVVEFSQQSEIWFLKTQVRLTWKYSVFQSFLDTPG